MDDEIAVVMRSPLIDLTRGGLVILFVGALGAAGVAAPRSWQGGTWMPRVDDRTLAIETDEVRVEVRAPDQTPTGPLGFKPGARVVFAIENTVVYVRTEKGAEVSLRIARTIDKKYTAVGGGHLLRAVTADGRFITLEDGSVWDVSPSDHFKTAHWEPGAVMSVTRLADGDEYKYELDNIDLDEGALANYQVKR
jgi:hypothetical protein